MTDEQIRLAADWWTGRLIEHTLPYVDHGHWFGPDIHVQHEQRQPTYTYEECMRFHGALTRRLQTIVNLPVIASPDCDAGRLLIEACHAADLEFGLCSTGKDLIDAFPPLTVMTFNFGGVQVRMTGGMPVEISDNGAAHTTAMALHARHANYLRVLTRSGSAAADAWLRGQSDPAARIAQDGALHSSEEHPASIYLHSFYSMQPSQVFETGATE